MISEYDEYYQTGGTYVLPVEILNQLLEEKEHLLDLQKNMDKQYEELENNWNMIKRMMKRIYNVTHDILLGEVLDYMEKIESGKNE